MTDCLKHKPTQTLTQEQSGGGAAHLLTNLALSGFARAIALARFSGLPPSTVFRTKAKPFSRPNLVKRSHDPKGSNGSNGAAVEDGGVRSNLSPHPNGTGVIHFLSETDANFRFAVPFGLNITKSVRYVRTPGVSTVPFISEHIN